MGQTYASSVFYMVNLAIVVDGLTKITNKVVLAGGTVCLTLCPLYIAVISLAVVFSL